MDILGFKTSSSDRWLLGCALAMLAWLITHRLSISRDLIQRRRISADAIIAAFQPELNAIMQTHDDVRHVLTDSAFKRHEAAILTHAGNLGWFKRWRLRQKWHRLAYHEQDKIVLIPFYAQYFDTGSLDKRRAIRPIVIQRMKDIISTLA